MLYQMYINFTGLKYGRRLIGYAYNSPHVNNTTSITTSALHLTTIVAPQNIVTLNIYNLMQVDEYVFMY